MVARQIIKEWVEKAEEDFGFASQTLADTSITYYAQICYHFQQAAEKYLKAYIVAFELEFRKIHDLPELLKICVKKEPKLKELSEQCEFLTDFSVDIRYPVHWPSKITKETAEEAKEATRKIRDMIRKLIEG